MIELKKIKYQFVEKKYNSFDEPVQETIIERTGNTTFRIKFPWDEVGIEFDASGLESPNSKRFELEQRKTEALEKIALVDWLPDESEDYIRNIVREEILDKIKLYNSGLLKDSEGKYISKE